MTNEKQLENQGRDPVKMAERANYSLAIFYLFISVLAYFIKPSQIKGIIFILSLSLILVIAGYFISEHKIIGVYFGWLFVLLGGVVALYNGVILGLALVVYIGYWNYKSQKKIKNLVKK